MKIAHFEGEKVVGFTLYIMYKMLEDSLYIKTRFRATEIKQVDTGTKTNRLTEQDRNQATLTYGCPIYSKAPLPFSVKFCYSQHD